MSDDSDYDLEGSALELNNIGMYDGDRNDDGERHGHGKAHFPNGDVFDGAYTKGKRNGFGTYRFKNARFDGEYKEGKRQGEGKMYYPDGSVYTGNWVDGDKSGMGTYVYPNGDTYVGEWKDDQKHGRGVYSYKKNGTVLKGHWVEGIREGPVEWVSKDHSFKGFFRNDQPFGRGKYVFENGCEQHGYYKITNLLEQVDKVMALVGRETRWTCTSLIRSPPKTIENKEQ